MERIKHEETLIQGRLITLLLATAMLLTAYAGLAGLVFTSIGRTAVEEFIPILMILAIIACGLGIVLAVLCLSSIKTSFNNAEFASVLSNGKFAAEQNRHHRRYAMAICSSVAGLWAAVAMATVIFCHWILELF